VTELERFFRRLVANLAGSDPARLHRPIPLEDILESIVPYRSNRRALLLESSEDYELVLDQDVADRQIILRRQQDQFDLRLSLDRPRPPPSRRDYE
jgi:hypothetical protein